MKLYAIAIMCASLTTLPLIVQKNGPNTPKEQIRIVAVDPTPEATTVAVLIQIPQQGQEVKGNPVWVQLRVDGYALGSASQFDRASELVDSKMGQTVHVVVDNLPYFPINGPSIDPFNEDGWYYNQRYKFEIPYKLNNGFHTLRVFPTRSFGESLKGERTFQAIYFFVGNEDDSSQASILNQPYLTYNEPSDQSYLVEGKPVLLDFYLTNTELSPDGYKVRMTIDGIQRTLTSWQPYYIYGLKKGKHTLRLELIDAKGKLLSGSFNDTQRHFQVN